MRHDYLFKIELEQYSSVFQLIRGAVQPLTVAVIGRVQTNHSHTFPF